MSAPRAGTITGVRNPTYVPPDADLAGLAGAARGCTACELYANATQTVFGEGSPAARLVLVGEQPGDQEDRQGRPFVGPAGGLLDRALSEAGIDRAAVYVTNAVKHFRFTERGKRRIHATPGRGHVRACQPWLAAELGAVRPDVVVCLGATAVSALLGTGYRVTKDRGALLPYAEGIRAVITTHPSAVLRMPGEKRAAAFAELVADLRVAAAALG
jgi:uracil-DNA glycosylase family protein